MTVRMRHTPIEREPDAPGEGPFRFQMRTAVERSVFTPNAWETVSFHTTLAEANAQAKKYDMTNWQEWRVSCCPHDVEAWLRHNHNLSHAPETASLLSKDKRPPNERT